MLCYFDGEWEEQFSSIASCAQNDSTVDFILKETAMFLIARGANHRLKEENHLVYSRVDFFLTEVV